MKSKSKLVADKTPPPPKARRVKSAEEEAAEADRAEQGESAALPAASPAAAQEPEPSPAPAPPRRTSGWKISDVVAPSVWREGGYLVLVYRISERGDIHFFSSQDGEHTMSGAEFVARMACKAEDINPHRLALNLLARLRIGTCQMRVKTERILADMLTIEELAKMSERQLADEYKRIMGEGPARIKAGVREQRIQEMLDKVRADAAKSTDTTSTEGKEGDTMATKKPAAKKNKAAKPPKATKAPKAAKAAKEPKAAKAPRAAKAPQGDGSNPFKPGTMKAAGFEFFLKHREDRAKCVEFMVAQGATANTANSWLSTFRNAAA